MNPLKVTSAKFFAFADRNKFGTKINRSKIKAITVLTQPRNPGNSAGYKDASYKEIHLELIQKMQNVFQINEKGVAFK